MQQRHWFATALSVGFLLMTPALVIAQDAPADQPAAQDQNQPAPKGPRLPKDCVDAGVTTPEDCKALIEKQRAEKAAAAEQNAAADKAAQEKAAQDKLAQEKAAQDKAAADQAAAEKAAEKAARDKAAADAAAQNKPATEAAPVTAPTAAPAPKLPRACVAAGISTREECDTFIAQQKADKAAADKAAQDKAAAGRAAQDKAAQDKAAQDKAAQDKAAADKAAADKAAADKAAADKAAADAAAAAQLGTAPANAAPADTAGKPAGNGKRLPKDCRDAGVTTQADCDALHAINAQKGKGKPPAVTPPATNDAAPAPADTAAPAAAAQPEQPKTLPAEVTPPKTGTPAAADQPAANNTPAVPDISKQLIAAQRGYNRTVEALAKAGSNAAAADKARADLKVVQARIDALCKSNQFDSTAQCLAQYGIQLAPIPRDQADGLQPLVTKPAQPVEVIDNLPKGVSKQDVAPLLDSAKDQETGKAPAGPAPTAGNGQTPPPVNNPPPTNDKAAQAKLKPQKFVPIDQQQGQQIGNGETAPKVEVPQNVTIINQTVVNNTTNVTNNTQNNNGPGQQNNGGPGQQPGGQPGRPGDHRPGQPGQPGGQPNPIGLGVQVILQLGNQLIINSPGMDQQRIADHPEDRTSYEQLPGGRYRETISRRDGVRIVTIYNRNGDILRRSRFDRDGHEYVLAYFDDRYDNDLSNWRDPGEDLPPLQLHIPARDYVLDADQADEGEVQQFFAQPPVEQVQRLYSIDEVKRSSRIRDMVRRLEIGDLTFDTGAATISEDQVGNLSKVAQAMLALLKKNPAETFLIEGHTDAVGSDIANLKLSDARAATVAQILTDFYHIPPENLATQGYGERYLKVQTDGPERLNRRVTIRRITSLVTVTGQNY